MLREIKKLGELTLLSGQRKKQIAKHELQDLFWECTLTCNARCKHCGSNAESKKYDGELTTGEIKSAFSQIAKDMNAKRILINVTGGEPLLRKDLFDVMKHVVGLGFRWGMTSNGMLFNDEILAKLQETNMETISISIDGIGETHDSFRGVAGSYDRILENIAKLKTVKAIRHLQVTTIFHKGNLAELEPLYDVMSGLGLTSWRVGVIDPIGRGKENAGLLLDGKEIQQILDFIKIKNRKGKLRITYACPSFLGLTYEKTVRGYYFNCRTGINIASILYNGDLFVCPNVPRRAELMQGNIRTDNFADVWNNKYKQFRTLDRTKCDYCSKCEHWKYCLGGAFHTWNFENNFQNRCVYDMIYKGEQKNAE